MAHAGKAFGNNGATVMLGNRPCQDVRHVTGEELTKITCILPTNVGAEKAVVISQVCLILFLRFCLIFLGFAFVPAPQEK
jgi:hypothetical protein